MNKESHIKIIVALILLQLFIASAVLAGKLDQSLPQIKGLPGMELQWIGRHMVINGVPTSMRAFHSKQSSEQILNAYQYRWKARGLGQVAVSSFDDNKSVGMEYRGHYYSVQVNDSNGGSEGVLTVSLSDLAAGPDFSTDFPLPYSSKVEQKIESLDNGVRAETLVVTSEQGVGSTAAFVQANLTREGWVEQNFAKSAESFSQYVLNYQRGRELSQIVILGNSPAFPDKTMMTIHWIKN